MIRQLALRQRIRKGILVLTFLTFAATMNYFSPVLVFEGAAQGTVNGSLALFGLLFVLSLFLGRLWCGWGCPAGGLQEMAEGVNRVPVNLRKADWIKWLIWVPWIAAIAWTAWKAGGYRAVDLLLGTQGGLSLAGQADRPIVFAYVIYFGVLLLIVLPGWFMGRRGFCHSFCWMAPFMIIGRKLANWIRLPGLRLQAMAESCSSCGTCTRNCPMSLPVTEMVKAEAMDHQECVLCGMCIDGCTTGSIRYRFGKPTKGEFEGGKAG